MAVSQTRCEASRASDAAVGSSTPKLAHSPFCSVAIVTFRRPERLRAAIASVRGQTGIDPGEFEILIVDNSPEASAENVVKAFPSTTPALRFVHELAPGPAHARNRAVAEARGELLAFLDDDETASPTWLGALIGALERARADAAFGKVVADFDFVPARHQAYAAKLYSRNFAARSGADLRTRHASLGTGNSIYRVANCFTGPEPFPAKVAAAGGEDTVFLRRLVKSGRHLVWAPDAVVVEHVPSDRVLPESLHARRFRQGQLRTLACLEGRADYLGLALWMAAGFTQAVKALLARLFWRLLAEMEKSEREAFEVSGGLGKIVWWLPSPTLYGAAGQDAADHPLCPKTRYFS